MEGSATERALEVTLREVWSPEPSVWQQALDPIRTKDQNLLEGTVRCKQASTEHSSKAWSYTQAWRQNQGWDS